MSCSDLPPEHLSHWNPLHALEGTLWLADILRYEVMTGVWGEVGGVCSVKVRRVGWREGGELDRPFIPQSHPGRPQADRAIATLESVIQAPAKA